MEPSETIPGGAYRSPSGAWHDADGNALTPAQIADYQALQATRKAGTPPDVEESPALTAPDPTDPTAKLAAAGFDTPEKIAAASDAELLAIEGIGPATLKKIRAGA